MIFQRQRMYSEETRFFFRAAYGVLGYQVQFVPGHSDNEVSLSFFGGWEILGRETLRFKAGMLQASKITWLWKAGSDWFIDFDQFKAWCTGIRLPDWLTGTANVIPEIKTRKSRNSQFDESYLLFRIFREEFLMEGKKKIFLSHKGVDKPLVRKFFNVLKALGFDPWLDEDAMPAGTSVNRGILDGFEQSCAAVFFVTPNFRDEQFLATEVEYAINEKRKKGDRFAIITIMLPENGQKGTVPKLLEPYVWKEPDSMLDALHEIIRALPIAVGVPQWRGHINPTKE